jgi:hypothetical protein
MRLWNFTSDFSEAEFYFVKGRGEDRLMQSFYRSNRQKNWNRAITH